MNEISSSIVVFLQLTFFVIVFGYGFFWIINRLSPNSKLQKKIMNKTARLLLYVIFEPFKKFYQVIEWLIVKAFITRPQFNYRQVFLENYPVTPLQFFAVAEEMFLSKQIEQAESLRVSRREGLLFQGRRLYLVIRFRGAAYFISGVPMGVNFLITLRFTKLPNKFLLILFQIPGLGAIIERLLTPQTFYQDDIYHAFEQSVRSSILEAGNALAELDEDIRPLNEDEQRPLLEEFYQ